MDSIGEKLKSTREARKLSLSDVTKDTNIAPTYLEALENEDFDYFPSETYAMGFLRNYADYLRLDSESMVQAYKGFKIGESVTPLEELTKPTGKMTSINFGVPSLGGAKRGIFVVIGCALAIVLFFILFNFISNGVDTSAEGSIDDLKSEYTSKGKTADFENLLALKLSNDKGMILASKDEAVQFIVGSKECYFLVKQINANSVDIQTHPEKTNYTLNLDQASKIVFPGANRDVSITLKALAGNRGKFLIELSGAADSAVDQSNASDSDSPQVTAQDDRNLKITFDAEFLENTYLELYLDGQQRISGLVRQGRKERWEASNAIQVKIGNAGGVKVKINDKDFVFGGKGTVASKTIKWEKDPANPNKYTISIKDWK
ncbi:MAG TPA: DUF4115 domain-containing protein [Spirochaetota bacterium]|nr:DUF4115 domain-containing protein [Spirochaetota bacterium]HOR44738.1 DUF4115 domain-containing protein [Spirochaetota bacterium]HOU84530.1 DUF4115 domain-containing protein [Spirochaetota bacterium]HPK56258.1 DUF4115 domain-containing protein [Spirochaetota bacterium]HQE58010.1 DUF4115 domain-containing protein [Spirochaetota bacterium]